MNNNNIEFRVIKSSGDTYYYIGFFKNNRHLYCFNKEMASLLQMSCRDYVQLAKSYGAVLTFGNQASIFYSKTKAGELAKYLNEKYIIIIALCDTLNKEGYYDIT